MQRLGERLNGAAFVLLLLLLAWAPLPLGSNRALAWHLLAVTAAITLLLCMTGAMLARERIGVPPSLASAGLLFGGVCAWAWLQATPGVLPSTWNHPFWAEAAATGLPVRPMVGLSAEATRDAVVRLLSYAAVFVTAYAVGRNVQQARRLLLVVFGIGVGYAVYGLIIHLGGFAIIVPGVERLQYARLHSSFVNPNHYATYAAIGMFAGAGLMLTGLFRTADTAHLPTLLARLLDGLFGARAGLVLGLVLLVAAALLTGSRGGFLALAAGWVTLVMLLYLRTRPRVTTAAALFLVLALAAWGLLRLSGELTLARLDQLDRPGEAGAGGRLAAYTLAIAMIAERPWLGHGYGAFAQAFWLHRTPDFDLLYDRLHNSWLELAVALGLPAAAALSASMLIVFGVIVRGVFRRRRHYEAPLAAAAASVAAGAHALVDFSLQIPAVAVTLAAVLGVAAAQATRPPANWHERDTGRAGHPAARPHADE